MTKLKKYILAFLVGTMFLLPASRSFADDDSFSYKLTEDQRKGFMNTLHESLKEVHSNLKLYNSRIEAMLGKKLYAQTAYSSNEELKYEDILTSWFDGIFTSEFSLSHWDLISENFQEINGVSVSTFQDNLDDWSGYTDHDWDTARIRIESRLVCADIKVDRWDVYAEQQRLKFALFYGVAKPSDCSDLYAAVADAQASWDATKLAYNKANRLLCILSEECQIFCECEDTSVESLEACKPEDLKCVAHKDQKGIEGASKNCKVLTIRLREITKCPLCTLFVKILNADQQMATDSFNKLATPFRNLILIIFAIYIAYHTLVSVTPFTKQDSGKFLTTISIQAFKVLVAFLLLSNSNYIYDFVVNPVLRAGLEFGIGAMPMDAKSGLEQFQTQTKIASQQIKEGVIRQEVLGNVVAAVQVLTDSAAMLPAIGGSLSCIATHEASPWEAVNMPSLQMWVEGLLLYVFGWMILLSASFYLIDSVIRFGIFCTLLPFFIAAWPFKVTQVYAKNGWNILLNIFFNFTLIGVVIDVSYRLVTQAVTSGKGGAEALEQAINEGDVGTLERMMDITGMQFLVLVACCLFAFKMVGQVNQLAKNISDAPGGPAIGSKLGGLAASAAKSGAGLAWSGVKATGRAAKFASDKSGLTDKIDKKVAPVRQKYNDARAAIGLGPNANPNGVGGSGGKPGNGPDGGKPEAGKDQAQNGEDKQNPQTNQNQAQGGQAQGGANATSGQGAGNAAGAAAQAQGGQAQGGANAAAGQGAENAAGGADQAQGGQAQGGANVAAGQGAGNAAGGAAQAQGGQAQGGANAAAGQGAGNAAGGAAQAQGGQAQGGANAAASGGNGSANNANSGKKQPPKHPKTTTVKAKDIFKKK